MSNLVLYAIEQRERADAAVVEAGHLRQKVRDLEAKALERLGELGRAYEAAVYALGRTHKTGCPGDTYPPTCTCGYYAAIKVWNALHRSLARRPTVSNPQREAEIRALKAKTDGNVWLTPEEEDRRDLLALLDAERERQRNWQHIAEVLSEYNDETAALAKEFLEFNEKHSTVAQEITRLKGELQAARERTEALERVLGRLTTAAVARDGSWQGCYYCNALSAKEPLRHNKGCPVKDANALIAPTPQAAKEVQGG